MDKAKKKPSREKPVVGMRGAALNARVPRPRRMLNKPVVYADGPDSKSDKASPIPGVFSRGYSCVHQCACCCALLCLAGLVLRSDAALCGCAQERQAAPQIELPIHISYQNKHVCEGRKLHAAPGTNWETQHLQRIRYNDKAATVHVVPCGYTANGFVLVPQFSLAVWPRHGPRPVAVELINTSDIIDTE